MGTIRLELNEVRAEQTLGRLHSNKQPATWIPAADMIKLGLSEVRVERSFMKAS